MTRLVILQHNVRHWATNRHALTNVYTKEDPHVILINSHGLTKDSLRLMNYNTHQSNKADEMHSGTAICIRRDVKYRLIDHFETDMIGVTVTTNQGPIDILTTYVAPRQPYLHYADFHKALTVDRPAYLIGDLNAKNTIFGHPSTNNRGQQLAMLTDRGHATILGPEFPTVITYRSATSPDIILGNSKTFHNYNATPGTELTPSDHNYIRMTISSSPIQIPIRPRPSLKRADWQTYRYILNQTPTVTQAPKTTDELEHLAEKWTEYVTIASNLTIPKVQYRTLPHYKQTDRTKRLQILYTDMMTEIERNGPSLERSRLLNNYRQELQTELRELSIQAWNTMVDKLDDEPDAKTFWSGVKKMMGNNTKQNATYLNKADGTRADEDSDKETIFRTYWSKVYTTDEDDEQQDELTNNLVEDLLNNSPELINPLPTSDIPNLPDPVTINELRRLVKNTRQKAPGPSGTTKNHIANLPVHAIRNFITLINHSLSIGYFPKAWKKSTMIFIPKPNKTPHLHTNYRPISLLEVPAKLAEKCINNRLNQTLSDRNLNNKRQHGFRSNHSTTTALAILHETLARKNGHSHRTSLVLRDISKAFDKVWHPGLLYKIISNDLPNHLTRIIANYLKDRTARIRIGTFTGPPIPLQCGVPQGGCLSPTLFNFYTSDTPDPHPQEQIIYADDITQVISTPSKSLALHAAATRRAIDNIDSFEKKWRIKTNKTKFTIVRIGRHNHQPILIDNEPHQLANKGTVLGLTIGFTGYKHHVKNRVAQANAQLNKLHRFRQMSLKHKRTLYLALIRSILTYPAIPMNSLSRSQMLKLQTVQNKGTRFITDHSKLDQLTSQQLHEQSDLLPINQVLFNLANDTWHNIRLHHPQETIQYILQRPYYDSLYFRSSLAAIATPPAPLYGRARRAVIPIHSDSD